MYSEHHDLARDVGRAIVKTAPPITVYALTLNEWLAVASIVYVALQASYLVWKWRGEMRRRAAAR